MFKELQKFLGEEKADVKIIINFPPEDIMQLLSTFEFPDKKREINMRYKQGKYYYYRTSTYNGLSKTGEFFYKSRLKNYYKFQYPIRVLSIIKEDLANFDLNMILDVEYSEILSAEIDGWTVEVTAVATAIPSEAMSKKQALFRNAEIDVFNSAYDYIHVVIKKSGKIMSISDFDIIVKIINAASETFFDQVTYKLHTKDLPVNFESAALYDDKIKIFKAFASIGKKCYLQIYDPENYKLITKNQCRVNLNNDAVEKFNLYEGEINDSGIFIYDILIYENKVLNQSVKNRHIYLINTKVDEFVAFEKKCSLMPLQNEVEILPSHHKYKYISDSGIYVKYSKLSAKFLIVPIEAKGCYIPENEGNSIYAIMCTKKMRGKIFRPPMEQYKRIMDQYGLLHNRRTQPAPFAPNKNKNLFIIQRRKKYKLGIYKCTLDIGKNKWTIGRSYDNGRIDDGYFGISCKKAFNIYKQLLCSKFAISTDEDIIAIQCATRRFKYYNNIYDDCKKDNSDAYNKLGLKCVKYVGKNVVVNDSRTIAAFVDKITDYENSVVICDFNKISKYIGHANYILCIDVMNEESYNFTYIVDYNQIGINANKKYGLIIL